MKRLLFGVALALFLNGFVYADRSGYLGTYETDRTLWKSSDIIINQASQPLTTGYLMIGYVQVISTGETSTIQFQECTSTTTGHTAIKFYGSSVPTNGNNGYATTELSDGKGTYVMEYSTMGWAYTTTGSKAAKLRVFYVETDQQSIPRSRP